MSATQSGGLRPRVGVLGLGRMGSAMAGRLAAQGFGVTGWTRSGIAPDVARALDMTIAPDIAALAAGSDVILLSLTDDAAVTAVLAELCQADLGGRLIVDTSTISPDTLRAQADALAKAGAAALDAPISGGPDMVLAGKAGFYIGGAAGDVARFTPVARALSDRIHHVGGLGAGAAAKIVNNMMLMGLWQSLKEALQLGKRAGLTIETMLELLKGSPAASGALIHRMPVLLRQSDAVGFTVAGVVKDGAVFERTLAQYGVFSPATAAAIASFRAHDANGHGAEDLATMARAAYDEA